MKKIAIVTPELVGLHKNGGIGTNYFFRSRFLSGCLHHQVTILYTGACSLDAVRNWREQYGQTGICLEILAELPVAANWESYHRRATLVHEWLKAGTWDEIHCAEFQANGFVCIQAKQAGLNYQNTRFVVAMHGSSLWCREGIPQEVVDPGTDTKLDYAERYCCENADTLISPSRSIIDWAVRKGWRLPPDRVLLPHLYEKLSSENESPARVNHRHLIFFGRLQTLKGLGIFCEAVKRLVNEGKAPARVDFLGKVGIHEGMSAEKYIRQMSSQWPDTETQIFGSLDNFAAMQHLRRTGGVAVIPSLRDNFPFTVIECIVNQVPFVASNMYGIPELADARVLFAPDARSLAAKLQEFSQLPPDTKFNHPYSLEAARQAWTKFASTPYENSTHPAGLPASSSKISVCVPFCNQGVDLPRALASLSQQTHNNFEVIVVDDGSMEASSRECFERLRKEYSGENSRFRFLTQSNAGIGAAWNLAAAQATGDILMFADADNIATEQMLTVFARAMVSGADCATCHCHIFHDDADLQKPPVESDAPLGPCLEAGWRENIFGQANFVVKKSAFVELGGFATGRSAVEDWQFLVRLAFKGFRQIVIPEKLYWHRHLAGSTIQESDGNQIASVIFQTYREGLSSWPSRIIENYVFASCLAGDDINAITIKSQTMLAGRKNGKQRGKFAIKLQRSTIKRLLELAGFIDRI